MQRLIQFIKLNFNTEDRNLIRDFTGTVMTGDRIGLIGKNGEGKSTFLKLLAGELQPDNGKIQLFSNMEYVPQLKTTENYNMRLYEFLSNITEEWWDILKSYEEVFGDTLDVNIQVKKLSGGELTKLFIIKAISNKPNLLLLDEPTNHLDVDSLSKLEKLLLSSGVSYVVVSHNIDFLNKTVSKIWEIENGELHKYNGNYDFYKIEKDKVLNSILRKKEVVQKKMKKTEIAKQKEQIKFQRSQRKLDKMAKTNDRSIPRILRNELKSQGQTRHGVNKNKIDSSLINLEAQLSNFKIPVRKKIRLEVVNQNQEGLLISIRNGILEFEDNNIILEDINFSIYSKDRIAILGKNGSGKSSLIKELGYEKTHYLKGDIVYGKPYKVLYLDQNYKNIHLDLNLIENMQAVNPHINLEQIRKILSNLGFYNNEDVVKNANILSGGEIARLGFALALTATLDILVLDEPTNNLDIFTKELIAKSLKEYKGTLIIISHDTQFLEDIGIEKYYYINERNLITN